MKASNIIKIVLDAIMAVLFVGLLFVKQTGLVFHEIAGLFIALLFLAHIALNWKWVVGVTKQIYAGRLKRKPTLYYALDLGLLIGVVMTIVTGVLISAELFPANGYDSMLVEVHKYSAYVTAGLMAAHIALHLKYWLIMCKRIGKSIKNPVTMRVFSGSAAMLAVVGIVYYSIASALNGRNSVTSMTTVPAIVEMNAPVKSTTGFGLILDEAITEESTVAESATTTETKTTKKREEEKQSTSTSQPSTEAVSLSDFLGKMFCTICPRHCPLSHPQCGRSANLIAQATMEYNALYEAQSSN